MSPGISSFLWFIAILGLIPLALWLLKRTPLGGAATGGLLRSVAVLPLSANQRLVTVEVGSGAERCWLVLGVTPQSITTLHTMAAQSDATTGLPDSSVSVSVSTAAAATAGFAQVLNRFRPHNKGSA